MSGKYALVNEWLGNRLGQQLNINTQSPFWITIDSQISIEPIHIEVRELIKKSAGLNIGFEYLENVIEVSEAYISDLDFAQTSEMFLLDLILINVDRSYSNTNLMFYDKQLYTIDYESSLLFLDVVHGKKLLTNTNVLKCLKRSPIYTEIEENLLNDFINKLGNVNFSSLCAEIPDSLLSADERKLFLEGMVKRKLDRWNLASTLDKLKKVEFLTKEQEKARSNRNQAEFLRKFELNK